MSHLRFGFQANEEELRLAIVEAGQIAYQRGLLDANDGNISTRLDSQRILLTPSHLCKGRLAPSDLLILDLSGNVLRGDIHPISNVSSQFPLHLEAYRLRPDIRAVIHAHPPYATALAACERPLPNKELSSIAIFTSTEDTMAIRELMSEHNAIILRQHGVLAIGVNLDEAIIALEKLEHAAMVIGLAEILKSANALPPNPRHRLDLIHSRLHP